MYRAAKFLLIGLLCGATLSILLALTGLAPSKWLSTSATLLALAAVPQAWLSGWFEKVIKIFTDEKEYPFGPPSNVTREIIDNPDAPIRTAIRNYLYFDQTTAVHFVVAAGVLQLISIWIG